MTRFDSVNPSTGAVTDFGTGGSGGGSADSKESKQDVGNTSLASIDAKQSTLIGHVDTVEQLLAAIDGDTSALSGAVSGTEMRVVVITMPTVTANAGTGPWPVTDNGGSLTVDGQITVSGAVSVSNFPATQPVSVAATVRAAQPIPVDGDVVAGSVLVNNSTTQTTAVTVPAGRTWKGSLTVTTYASGTAAATQANAQIRTLGAGVVPAAGTVVGFALTHLVGVAGVPTRHNFNDVIVKAPAGNAVTITVTNSTATAFVSATSANGVLL